MRNIKVAVQHSLARDRDPINLDMYQCGNCDEFSHHEQCIQTAPHGLPQFCPYCGSKSIKWRGDDMYVLVEI